MDVSILVVAWNVKELLYDCLKSVYDETKGVEFEVIYVDNGSVDGSVKMVRREFPQTRIIENPDNKGFIRANNQAIEVARGRYVLLLNSDTIVLKNAIAKVIGFADQHPQAAVVGCRVLNPDGSVQENCFRFYSTLNMLFDHDAVTSAPCTRSSGASPSPRCRSRCSPDRRPAVAGANGLRRSRRTARRGAQRRISRPGSSSTCTSTPCRSRCRSSSPRCSPRQSAVVVGAGSLRVRGLMLAVTTFVFTVAAQQYFYRQPLLSGGSASLVSFPRGTDVGIDLSSQHTAYTGRFSWCSSSRSAS